MAGKNQYTAAQFIAAIPGTGGIISAIAESVGCTWDTAKRYINDYATIKQAYDNECERVMDLAESVLIKSIKGGDSADAKWWLTRKGKGRGFVERSEVTGADGGPVEFSITEWQKKYQERIAETAETATLFDDDNLDT